MSDVDEAVREGLAAGAYLTVGRLKALLEGHDDGVLVVLSSDGEGNSYSPLADVDGGHYEPESTWGGSVPHEDDDDGSGIPCLVLWPVN